jgi:hypothetical protein
LRVKEKIMPRLKSIGSAAVLGALMSSLSAAPAQVSINIGTPPLCPYGYFDYAPYACAPYGYYGPDWFTGGVFIGAGPWFHGPHGFYGHVDNRFDPHYGYHGPLPDRGEHAFSHFHANEARDGRGHVGNAGHDFHGEHSAGFQGGHGGGHGGGHH